VDRAQPGCKARTKALPFRQTRVTAAKRFRAGPASRRFGDALGTVGAMTPARSTSLSPVLVERLSQRDLPRRLGVGLPFVTVDAQGRPHPMLASYLEVRAYDAGTVGLVIQAHSTSARNLAERQTGTLLVIEPDVIVYVKLRALDGPLPVEGGEPFGLGYFLLEVEDVREDAAADWEAGMRVTEPIRYAPPPDLGAPWARATLAALAAPRARA